MTSPFRKNKPQGFVSDQERRRNPRDFGVPSQRDALELALRTMLESYDTLICAFPEGTIARNLAVGSFGKAPEIAREVLGMKP